MRASQKLGNKQREKRLAIIPPLLGERSAKLRLLYLHVADIVLNGQIRLFVGLHLAAGERMIDDFIVFEYLNVWLQELWLFIG